MPAPSSKQMAQLAKTQFVASVQILPHEFPISYMTDPHWNGAFVSGDLSVPPLPVNPSAALFLCVSTNKQHVETQAKISALFHMYIDTICKAICCAWQDWAKQAVLQNVAINGANASGGTVTGPAWEPVIAKKGPTNTKMLKLYTHAVAKAVGDAWTKYEASLKPLNLPWYPKFALATPGPNPPTKNIPTPVAQLQQDASSLARGALRGALLKQLNVHVSIGQVISVASCAAGGGGVTGAVVAAGKGLITGSIRPHSNALMDSLAYAFETVFKTWQTTSQVTQVFGSGVNPSQVAAPIVNGIANMTPGGFDAARPDTAMMLSALGKLEGGNVRGVYDDRAWARGVPNESKPVLGLDFGGSNAIGYGTDLRQQPDWKRSLFAKLGYAVDPKDPDNDFDKFLRQELFLKDGEAEKLFELSMTDQPNGYIAEATKHFPGLATFPLDQQIGLIDIIYNYGTGHLGKVRDAVASGDWTTAGDEVLDLPITRKVNNTWVASTFGKSNPTRANAIRARLQTPLPPDPCA